MARRQVFHVKHCAASWAVPLADQVIEQIDISARYSGYIDKQQEQIARVPGGREHASSRIAGLRRCPCPVVRGAPGPRQAPSRNDRTGVAPAGRHAGRDRASPRPPQKAATIVGGQRRRGASRERLSDRAVAGDLPHLEASLADARAGLAPVLVRRAVGTTARVRRAALALESHLQPDRRARQVGHAHAPRGRLPCRGSSAASRAFALPRRDGFSMSAAAAACRASFSRSCRARTQ